MPDENQPEQIQQPEPQPESVPTPVANTTPVVDTPAPIVPQEPAIPTPQTTDTLEAPTEDSVQTVTVLPWYKRLRKRHKALTLLVAFIIGWNIPNILPAIAPAPTLVPTITIAPTISVTPTITLVPRPTSFFLKTTSSTPQVRQPLSK